MKQHKKAKKEVTEKRKVKLERAKKSKHLIFVGDHLDVKNLSSMKKKIYR